MTNELIPYSDLERMGTMLAKSGLFGMKKPEEAIALCLIAQAEGKHPATAAQEYNIILGRPALKADAMLARFQAAGGKVKWLSYTDKEVTGEFSHPQGGSVPITWNIEMAVKLGYDKKDNWKKFPRAMMRARCISEGVRTVYPGIASGMYTPEEVQDFDDNKMMDITPSETDNSKPKSPFKTATSRNLFCKNTKEAFLRSINKAELDTINELNKDKFAEMDISGAEADQLALEELRKAYKVSVARIDSEKAALEELEESEAQRERRVAEGSEPPSEFSRSDNGTSKHLDDVINF